MPRIVIKADSILSRYGNMLAAVSDGDARRAFARALNHEGDKGRTQVKRALVQVTGIKYGMIERGMATRRATQTSLEYKLEQRGNETNLNLFGARETASGVSAAPWNRRRIFKSSFIIEAYGGKVYLRVGSRRFPIRQLYGPNLAREIIKGAPAEAWEMGARSLQDRVSHELARMLKS